MKNLNITYEQKVYDKMSKAKEHSKKNWEDFIYYCVQLYWKEETKKRHPTLK